MNGRRFSSLAFSLAIPLLFLSGCGAPIGDTTQSAPATAPTGSAATSPATSAATATQAASQGTDGTTTSGDTVQCGYLADGTAAKPVSPPSSTAQATGTVSFVMHMDAGDVTLTMDRSKAPCTVNSFESLADQGYFDDTSCHRLAPDFVLQCGDPTATGRGGPGYRYADELTGTETYPYGTLAMANAGPNTNGSQFFIIIADGVRLAPSYTVFGSVDAAGMQVIEAIAAQGGVDPSNAQGSAPKEGGHIKAVAEVNG